MAWRGFTKESKEYLGYRGMKFNEKLNFWFMYFTKSAPYFYFYKIYDWVDEALS